MENRSFVPVPAARRDLLTEMDLSGIRLTESRHPATTVIPRHAHRRATINILVAGSFEEIYPGRRDLHCQATSILVRPPGADHLDKLGRAGACNLVLELDDQRLESIRTHSRVFEDIRLLQTQAAFSAVARLRRELKIRDGATPMALEGLSLELLSVVARDRLSKNVGSSSWLRRVTEILHDRFRDPTLRFRDLAAEAGVHPVSLARAFRAAHGVSPGEYLRGLRVEWAAGRVRSTDRPLSEIALDSGFSDQSHLSRIFKARYGQSPSAWRRMHRQHKKP